MRIRIDYTTAYDYSEPAGGVVRMLRVQPRSGWDQNVSRWRIDVDADGALRPGTDVFGNWTHLFTAEAPVTRLTLTVTGEVETSDAFGSVRGFAEPLGPGLFLRSTDLSKPDAAIAAFARDRGEGDVLDRLHALNLAIGEHMAFDADATGTDAATAFAKAAGVAQDYTHIFCAAARLLGVPARYVSGHFVRDDESTQQSAGHAWAEALVPDLGWVGFDPTNGVSTTPAHVRVAVGLDYLDAAPIRGARRGGGTETMHVAVSAVDMAAATGQSRGPQGQSPQPGPSGQSQRQGR